MLLFITVFGKPPFDGSQTVTLVKSIKKASIRLKDNKWNDELRIFLSLVQEMLQADVDCRIDLLDALNHEFFLKENDQLEQLAFKRQSLSELEEFWNFVTLKNEIKNFGQFMASCYHPSSLIERIFEAKQATTVK